MGEIEKQKISIDQMRSALDYRPLKKPKCFKHVIRNLIKRWENVVAEVESTEMADRTVSPIAPTQTTFNYA